MKREIIFRGKRVDKKSFTEGFLINKDTIRKYYHGGEYMDFKVIPETVSQFTGLLDKNGKEIFEGDILDNMEIVKYSNGCFMTSIGALVLSSEHREIIGNIHDHAKL